MSAPFQLHQTFDALLPPHWKREVENWVKDDCPSIDIGGLVVGNKVEEAILYGKSKGILAGVPFYNAVFEYLGCSVAWKYEEGALIDPGQDKIVVGTVVGPARNILLGERTALNLLSRASGVASAADAASQIARDHAWHGHVAGTRKTTPGFRIVEKYALLVGGASTHRLDLSNMVMLKDNHVWSAGSIPNAIKIAKRAAGFSSKIEVECRSLEEAHEAASNGADIVMLDNFDPEQLKMAAALLKASHPYLIIEASGGITLQTMHKYFSPHVDVISRGNLTQGYSCVDFSLKIKHGSNMVSMYPASSSISAMQQMSVSSHMNFTMDDLKPKKKTRRKSSKQLPERVVVPGAYRCIKGPAIAYRLSMNLDNRDQGTQPVKIGDTILGCVECTAENQLGATWLQVIPIGATSPRYLPTFIDGDALFEPVLEVVVTYPKKPYEVPEMQKYYTVFSSLIRGEVKASMPDAIRGDINKEIGRRWRELTDEQKRQYTQDMLPEKKGSDDGGNVSSTSSLKRSHEDNDEDDFEEEDDIEENQIQAPAHPLTIV